MNKEETNSQEDYIAGEQEEAAPQKITIMNYNIQMLPVHLKLTLNTWIRRKAIIEHIVFLDNMYDIDILVLNEVFTSTILKLLITGVVAEKFPYYTNVLGSRFKSLKRAYDTSAIKDETHAVTIDIDEISEYENCNETTSALKDGILHHENAKEQAYADSTTDIETATVNIYDKSKLNDIDVSYNTTSSRNDESNRTLKGEKNYCDVYKKEKGQRFDFVTTTRRRKFYQVLNGGVIVFSKHKILTAHALLYSHSIFPDSMSSKGAIYAKFLVYKKKVNLVATHLQAGDEPRHQICRIKQIKELSDWVYTGIPSSYIKQSEPLFFVGDLNIRFPIDRTFLNMVMSKENLNCNLTREDLETTYDSALNDYCRLIENDYALKFRYTLDYIFVSKKSKVKTIVPQTAVQKPYKPIIFIKFLFSFIPYKTTYVHHPSDHFPIYAIFHI